MSKRHQLNEEETRIYAAGMAARRRGERNPKEILRNDQYKLWRAGWNRIGRKPYTTNNMRSGDHNTLCEGMHCIHTEVKSFDDALKLLEIRQRAKAITAARKSRPIGWKEELRSHNARKTSPIGHAVAVAQTDAVSEFERHIVGRVLTAVQELGRGVEEMSAISAMYTKFSAVNPRTLMNIITSLCHLIKMDVPDFSVHRAPVHKPLPHCINCGAELAKDELEYCRHCDPARDHERVAAKLLREHHARLGGLRREVKELDKLTYKVSRRVIDHDDSQGHGGHPSEVAGNLEAGRRKENVLVASKLHISLARAVLETLKVEIAAAHLSQNNIASVPVIGRQALRLRDQQ